MDLIFNELSLHPLFDSLQDAEIKFHQFLIVFNDAKGKFGFKNIRVLKSISNQPITRDLNYIQLVANLQNKVLKNTLISFIKPPYLDDLSAAEMEEFYKTDYEVVGDDCPTEEAPFGLPIAYIKNKPAISVDAHDFWRKKIITIKRTGATPDEESEVEVYNLCLQNDINSPEITEWSDHALIQTIVDKDRLILYLRFTKYQVEVEDMFFDQLMAWKNNDFDIYCYILELMKDVQLHPFTGGKGQTENLAYRGKEASKRITNSYPDGHRLSYAIENNIVTFIACYGHYEFH